jgi:hypothetical protein
VEGFATSQSQDALRLETLLSSNRTAVDAADVSHASLSGKQIER